MTEAETTQKSPRSPVHWLRWLLLVLALILGIPLVLIAALLLALRSETGTEWVIDRVPGLTVDAGRGSLFGQWQAQSLHWRGYGVDLQVSQPDIDWSPTCLFEKTLCLDRLHAAAITLATQPGEDSGDSGFDSMPPIALPVTVQIRDIQLGTFHLNGNLIWDQLSLAATGSGSDWQLQALNYQREEVDLTLAGRLETRGDWPLDMSLTGALPPPYGDQWTVDIAFRGSVEQLRFAGNSEGYLSARIEGSTEPLNPVLPARVSLVSDQFRALDSLPETLTLNDLNLSLNGSLEQGFATRVSASLPSSVGAMAMNVQGHLTTLGVDQLLLTVKAPSEGDAAPGDARIDGSLSWQEQIAAEGELALKAFPWYALIPDMEKPPVTVNTLDGQGSYRGGDYQASLSATVDGPSGAAELQTQVTGDHQKLSLTGLSLSSGAGGMTGEADIGFDGPLNWDARLALDGFDPGYWVPALSADLDGSLASHGQMTAEGLPELQVQSDLQGTWRDHPAELQLSAGGSPEDWALSTLVVEVGGNRLNGQGTWRKVLDGDFRLELPEPGLFHPDLQGTLGASVSVAGTPADPQGQVLLSARELAWRGSVEIDSAQLQADLDQGLKLAADLRASGVSAAGQTLDEVNLQLQGTRADHRLSLDAGNEDVSLSLVFAGLFEESWGAWRGQVQEGTIELPQEDMSWLLEQPATLAWQNKGSVTVGEHCWAMDDASVCAGDQRLYPDTRISYAIRQFPTRALSPLLPEDLRWNTLLNADLDLSFGGPGPEGQLSVDAGSGSLEVLALDGWKNLDYERLSVSLALQPDQADLKLELKGSQLGAFQADLQIDPMAAEKTVNGSFSLKELNLALATAFTDLEQLEGKLEGQGQLSGPLLKPAVDGELVLTGGKVQDGRLPMALEEMVATLELKGYSAALDGRWQSGERSSGTLAGEFDWEHGPAGELSLQGDRLPFRYEPYARLELEPDLTMSFRDGDLSVQGRVGVPRGDIEIKELPAQAVSVSEDEVLVGVEAEPPLIRKLDLNITVVVGDDRVSFVGFGVTGDLEGVLRIGDDLDTRGSLVLVNGQYEAYGQELELRRARLVFDGPVGQPYLDIEAIRRVDTVVAGIRLSGPISSPRTEVFSEPSMPQSQALSYVILGRPLQSQGDEGQMSRAAISLGLTQTAGITREIGEEFGIRDLTLEAEGSGEESSVVAKGYITDELSLRYGVGIFEPISTVALRYDLGRYFYLEAASGLAASLDIFYTRDF